MDVGKFPQQVRHRRWGLRGLLGETRRTPDAPDTFSRLSTGLSMKLQISKEISILTATSFRISPF